MVAMALSCTFGKEPSFFSPFCQKQVLFRSGFPRIIVQEPVSKSNSLTQTKISCKIGQGSATVSKNEVVLLGARQEFSKEVAYRKSDNEVSLVKALLLISAEDEAFMSLNREKDRLAAYTEGRNVSGSHAEACEVDGDDFHIAGRTMSMWLARFEFLAKEVKDLLASKRGCLKPVHILKAVSTVLFEIQGFKRTVTDLDARSFYLHLVLTLGSGSGMLICIIFMEVCRRLGVNVKGAEVDDELLMWPHLDDLQEFNEPHDDLKSLFTEILAFHHSSHLLGTNSGSLTHGPPTSPTVKLASNREILGLVLSKLKNTHWKDACKARPGFALTDCLHPLIYSNGRLVDHTELDVGALLRPISLRLALMASERLLLLQPHSWILRRDHGLLLYHSRRYGEAVQELSICTAFAPTVEAHTLEHFVEKLHLLRIESSWSSFRPPSAPSTLA